jgi:hypothetical protein
VVGIEYHAHEAATRALSFDGTGSLMLASEPTQDGSSLSPNDTADPELPVQSVDDEGAIVKLGEWLRDQQTMEETISILQQEGWMV